MRFINLWPWLSLRVTKQSNHAKEKIQISFDFYLMLKPAQFCFLIEICK